MTSTTISERPAEATETSSTTTMPGDVVLRPARTTDLPRIVELNNASTPAVPHTGESEMAELVDSSTLTLVAAEPETDEPVGFVVAFDGDATFEAENFDWFAERDYSHYYVDRIVLGEGARDRGVGRKFYDEIFDEARRNGRKEVTCEVNIEPMNAGSLRFHGRLGFEDRGEQLIHEGTVTVRKLAAPVR
ncbi:GNAT family acetyltransferase [Paraoerskovia sediminicola]|uniref:GNAT family acetyltransferase n=1 Tax=Paraoerskovia sediminicola TaxID=1138587 RepID=A0ABM8G4T2_9CELL|nr:GNAT family N-acetyltransferase [Paraoerskovia sediminicola]BDZ43049.1 GNAT family acetyltransferase [Paraoerskovia sediminicola]